MGTSEGSSGSIRMHASSFSVFVIVLAVPFSIFVSNLLLSFLIITLTLCGDGFFTIFDKCLTQNMTYTNNAMMLKQIITTETRLFLGNLNAKCHCSTIQIKYITIKYKKINKYINFSEFKNRVLRKLLFFYTLINHSY